MFTRGYTLQLSNFFWPTHGSHTKPGHWFSLDHRGPSTAPVTGQIHGEAPTDTWFAGKSTKEIEVEWGLLWMS